MYISIKILNNILHNFYFSKDGKCFINLYKHNLNIIEPIDNIEMAQKIYLNNYKNYFKPN